MESVDVNCNCPDNFEFPFPPYQIQNDFMSEMYKVINERKLGIFESPTGTGKTLSIVCGALRWLRDYNENQKIALNAVITTLEEEKKQLVEDSDDWLTTQAKRIQINEKLTAINVQRNKISQYEEKITNILKKENKKKITSNKIEEETESNEEDINDEMLILDEFGDEESNVYDDQNDDKYEPVKIYICSRTHSQLTQFVGEIVKSPFDNVRTVSLASRQIYCINSTVRHLKSLLLINERCLDIQKGNTKKTKQDNDGKTTKKRRTENDTCPYNKQQNIENLKEHSLINILDVEDLVTAGKSLKACPYYSSRKAAEEAEIILIPYNTLLHHATRTANRIKLKNNVVIIDEAHNLMESIAQMYTNDLNLLQLDHALLQLKGYKSRFSTRFSPSNLLMINQLLFVMNKLKHLLEKDIENLKGAKTEILTHFIFLAGIDKINISDLIQFTKDAKLSQKIHHYALKYPQLKAPIKKGVKDFLTSLKKDANMKVPQQEEIKKIDPAPTNPLLSVISFLESLSYSFEDGRVLLTQNIDRTACKLQFLLLNPSCYFKNIVEEARSVILAGGTMQPMEEFRDRLFINAGAQPERIIEFTCDHIIPPDNILPIIVTEGPGGNQLLFNFDNRMKMGENIKTILTEACKKVPGGIVVFFPSYQYENWVWQNLKNVNFNRPVFREPKETGQVEQVLQKYATTITKARKTGALMFSVVGGKLSEGLNFNDDLGRCVIVVGLPYANIKATDLQEKITYLDRKEGAGAGKKFYENLCMKAVNQCIGRAVRHKNDYASVLLLDQRYTRNSCKNALPEWIKRSLQVGNFSLAFSAIEEFFRTKD